MPCLFTCCGLELELQPSVSHKIIAILVTMDYDENFTYFGRPTFRLVTSNVMSEGSSAPSQQVTIFAVDFVLLRRPTINVTMGNAF